MVAAAGGSGGGPSAAIADAFTPPPIRHVWIINLENAGYPTSFGSPSTVPYLAQTLPSQGVLLRQYYGIGHESLDNYVAQVSGQSPTPQTQEDCSPNSDFTDSGTDTNGQVIGQGCVYPFRVDTIGQQMDARGLTWKGYMEDMEANSGRFNGVKCAHIPIGGNDPGVDTFNAYAPKHNPFVYFHRIIDDEPYCQAHDVPLTPLAHDLQRISTTPNLGYITPNMFNDEHDAGLDRSDRWLRQYVRMIMASPAYRQDGMVIVTFDETGTFGANPLDDTACCNEIPGPNTPMPGIGGPGGGVVGAVILSPFVRPGTVTDTPYNHYSLLRSLEDLFRIQTGGDDGHGHLGYAGTYTTYAGPGAFGADVYTENHASSAAPVVPGPPGSARAADGSSTWASPGPQGNDLKAVSCASDTDCVAVGDTGAIVTTSDGQTWTGHDPPTGEDLRGVSCANASDCVAVGTGGKILSSADGGQTWASRSSGVAQALNGVSCPSQSDCVAVGDGGTIVTSADGGLTWSSTISGTQQALNAVSCPSVSRCFAVGEQATILRSNGGGNWSAQAAPALPLRYFSITCPTESDCLAVGDLGSWVATSNGGASWQTVGAGGVHPFGVSCPSPSICLVAGTSSTFPAYGDRSAGLFVVTDTRGTNRTMLDSGAMNSRDAQRFDALSAVACPTGNRCFAVGAHGEIISISNLPASQSDPPPTWSQQRLGPVRDLGGLSCASETSCFAVGNSAPDCTIGACNVNDARTPATILATSDGVQWAEQDPGTRERLNAVSCASASACVAVGDLGTVVRTQDGSTWQAIPDPSGTRGAATLLGVSCPSGTSICVAVGDHGSAFRSDAGGSTWSSVASGTQESLNAVNCASASACVAVGSSGTILDSTDGGGSWSSSGSPTTNPLFGASCPTAQSCFAVGSNGTALASGDGGQTWAAQQTPANGADLLAVSCASASACSATGSDGTVLVTSNAGATWTPRGTGTARALAAVSCPTTRTCYEAGDFGAVLGPPQRGYPRPKGATPLRASLVVAYTPCTNPTEMHGAPLSAGACSPPMQSSSQLTVDTLDSNQRAANMVGSVRYDVRQGDPQTPANEADVLLNVTVTDVRNKSDLSDYTGELQVMGSARITDRQNGPSQNEPATMQDISFPATVPCAGTSDPGVGGTCSLTSSFDSIVPGAVVESKRAIWQLGQVTVFDGGPDGLASTGSGNDVFAVQGVFAP